MLGLARVEWRRRTTRMPEVLSVDGCVMVCYNESGGTRSLVYLRVGTAGRDSLCAASSIAVFRSGKQRGPPSDTACEVGPAECPNRPGL